MKHRKLLVYLLISLIIFNTCACSKKAPEKEKQLNLYLDVKDKYSMNLIKFFIDEYKKDNPKIKVNLSNALGGGNLLEDISKGTEADIIFTSRNSLIELSQKGLISDMGSYYEKNKFSDKYFKIMTEYGRVGDKYFGIGLVPYTVEILYNTAALRNLSLNPPNNIMDVKAVLAKLKASSIRVPLILTEDIDRYGGAASILANNIINSQKLENSYGSSKDNYKEVKEMQTFFNSINTLVKSGIVDKNTFELGDETSINSLNKGNIPMLITISYYNNRFETANIGLLEDYSFSNNLKPNIPIIVNSVLSVATNSKNGEETADFIKTVFGDDMQKRLVQKGFISGDKKANENAIGLNKSSVNQISNSNENSILFLYNMPYRLSNEVVVRINNILMGKYTGKEWQEAVESGQ